MMALGILLRDHADLVSLTFILAVRFCRSWIFKVCSSLRSWESWILRILDLNFLFHRGILEVLDLIFFCFAVGSRRSWILNFSLVVIFWRFWILTKGLCRGVQQLLDLDILFCRQILRILDPNFWPRHMSVPFDRLCPLPNTEPLADATEPSRVPIVHYIRVGSIPLSRSVSPQCSDTAPAHDFGGVVRQTSPQG